MNTKLHLDLLMFEFGEAFRDEPLRGLGAFEALLADQPCLLARITYLERLQQHLPAQLAGELPPAKQTFRDEIEVIATSGLQAAWKQGTLTPERLAALVCDPQALRALHDRLVSIEAAAEQDSGELGDPTTQPAMPEPSAAAVQAHQGSVPEGLTQLARSGRNEDFQQRFEPWLPYLLDELGLDGRDPQLQKQLLQFVRSCLDDLGERRFSAVLPGWLREFAEVRQPLPDDFLKRFVERAAVRRVLEARAAHEPAWAASFRRQALDAPPASPLELLHFQAGDVSASAPSLASFRRDLFREANRTCSEGFELFELSLN